MDLEKLSREELIKILEQAKSWYDFEVCQCLRPTNDYDNCDRCSRYGCRSCLRKSSEEMEIFLTYILKLGLSFEIANYFKKLLRRRFTICDSCGQMLCGQCRLANPLFEFEVVTNHLFYPKWTYKCKKCIDQKK